ncbi:MAG: hypothetical protein ACLUN9_26605 [Enterocloster aldenensis]
MRLLGRVSFLLILLTVTFSFNVFAMPDYLSVEPKSYTPQTEKKTGDKAQDYYWTWLNDEIVVRFRAGKTGNVSRKPLQEKFDYGGIEGGHGLMDDGGKREIYSGKWSQTDDGIWAFVFDDSTIPIDLTRIDGVLYAFNGYGELVDGYKYWNDYKTGPDGLVTCTEPEFLAYLETQYIPDCTSHE